MRAILAVIMAVVAGCAARPARPWVFVNPGQDVQTCAVVHPRGSIRDWESPHAHLVFFFTPRGKIAHGDSLLVEVPSGKSEAAKVRFGLDPSLTGIQTMAFGYPGGLGEHEVVATWLDAEGRVKARSSQTQTVWNCGRANEWTGIASDP